MRPRLLRSRLRRAGRCALLAATLAAPAMPAPASEPFPFGRELLLDAAPMKGSKRVPSLDIAENGTADIALWCNNVQARLIVVADTITILTGAKTARACPPERMQGDDALLVALADVAKWSLDGGILVLTGGATPLRFRVQTN